VRRPLLAPWYRVVGDGDRLLLEHGQAVVVLEGAAVGTLLPALLPLLDGTRTVEDLVARLGPAVRPAVEHALATLEANGLLVEGPDAAGAGREAAAALAAAFGLPPAVAAARLRAGTVGIVGGGVEGVEAARLLHACGVGEVRRLSWRAVGVVDLALVAPAPDELDRLPAFNRRALGRELRWLLVRPFDGRLAAVGPLVVPGQTACYECLLLRRGANCGYGEELAALESAPLAARADAAFAAMAAALAAHVALRWLGGRDPALPGLLLALEARPALRLGEHAVLRVPRCPACSAVDRAAPLPWHGAAEAA